MNMSHTPPPPDDRPEREAREWLAQEQALREELAGLPVDARDPRVAQYRLLVRALRTPAMEPLPADFAAQTARRIESGAALGDRLERWLLNGLIAVLAVASLFALLLYGGAWWHSITATAAWAPAGAGDWLSVLALCAGGSWLWDRVVRSDTGDRAPPAQAA